MILKIIKLYSLHKRKLNKYDLYTIKCKVEFSFMIENFEEFKREDEKSIAFIKNSVIMYV